MPRSRRWTTDSSQQEPPPQAGRGATKWEPTLAFPKMGAHRATLGDRLFAEVHIDVKVQQERESARGDSTMDGTASRLSTPFIESVVYDYIGVQDERTLIIRETSRQGERIERSMLYVRLNADAPTKIRFPSGVVSVVLDEEQVAIVRWVGT
ncbi:MAG: hypothetical protein M3Z37_03765 [Candidatus Eremiobacteraeota bacterium]|nr:hypothetical protein [Candidatus Eremiobacteraeota bacterium]